METPKPKWLKDYEARSEIRSKLPDVPIEVSHHARRRGKQRCGLSREQILDQLQGAKAFQAETDRWIVLISGRKGIAEAVLILDPEFRWLKVVSLIPIGPASRECMCSRKRFCRLQREYIIKEEKHECLSI